MSDELKPCPFCGWKSPAIEGSDDIGVAWGQCGSCAVQGPAEDTVPEAVTAWNTRAAISALHGEEMREKIARVVREHYGDGDDGTDRADFERKESLACAAAIIVLIGGDPK